MAKKEIVWGIDVGNTSLKALRCCVGNEPGTIEVLGFDFIEHSKVLSQPGAEASEIMAETLAKFLSRNNIRGEKVAISVNGQSALWRCMPLPPFDHRKLKDLVKYEVRNWLPFDSDNIILNYRRIGGMQVEHMVMDAYLFTYAMKKELTLKTLDTYQKNGLHVDCIQGAPISLFNCFVKEQVDPNKDDNAELDFPTPSTDYDVILNIGTDTSEIVITNGEIVWLRNIPIGGNAFTKALTKSLKLTFSNAEHIKRNAATSQDPKAVILAMKPVFNEILNELDRSIKYYCSQNKQANIRKIYALGNGMKLPGLRQFLAKSSGYEVEVPTQFRQLRGPEVLSNPQFSENLSSFAVAYGLVLQLLHRSSLDVNLMPAEILRERLINSKKPWALAASAILLLAMTIQFIGANTAFKKIDTPASAQAVSQAKKVNDESKKLIKDTDTSVTAFKKIDSVGKNLTSNVEGRLAWMELLTTLNTIFPAETLPPESFTKSTREKAADITAQNRVYIDNIDVYTCSDLSLWFNSVRKWYTIDDTEAQWFVEGATVTPEQGFNFTPAVVQTTTTPAAKNGIGGIKSAKPAGAAVGARPAAATAKPGAAAAGAKPAAGAVGAKPAVGVKGVAGAAGAAVSGGTIPTIESTNDPRLELIPPPTGAGKIVQLSCYHYHNSVELDNANRGPEYVRRVFLPRIKHGSIELPISLERQRKEGMKTETWTLKEFGLNYPVMIEPGPIDDNYRLLDPEAAMEQYRSIRENSVKSSQTAGGMRNTGMGGPGMGAGMGAGMSASGGMDTMGESPSGQQLNNIAGKMKDEKILNLRRFDFIIQMVWVETPPSLRETQRAEKLAAGTNSTGDGTNANNPAKGVNGASAAGTKPVTGMAAPSAPAGSPAAAPSPTAPNASSTAVPPVAPAPPAATVPPTAEGSATDSVPSATEAEETPSANPVVGQPQSAAPEEAQSPPADTQIPPEGSSTPNQGTNP